MTVVLVVLVVGGGSAAVATGSGVEKPAVEVPVPQAEVVPASVPVVYVATGLNFPDALGGGPVAAVHDGPILLVRQDSIPASTAAELSRLNPDKIVILGGTGVVSAGVATTLASYTTGAVERLSGADRYETAAAISAANFPAPQITVATGWSGNTTEILSAPGCTSYEGMAVTIDTPVAGTIVLHANVQLWMQHVTGTDTYVQVGINDSPTDCGFLNGFDGSVLAWASSPTEQTYPTVPVSHVVEVGPGVHTFYITGTQGSGAAPSYFNWAGMDAVFYPNP
jgi:hypothetical protein